MKTLFGAVAGALTLGAVLVSYGLGAHHTFSSDPAFAAGYQPNPYLVQTGQTGYVSPYAPYATRCGARPPYGVPPAGYGAAGPVATPAGYAVPQYATQRV